MWFLRILEEALLEYWYISDFWLVGLAAIQSFPPQRSPWNWIAPYKYNLYSSIPGFI
jgi:hypothetical protein